MNKIITIFSLIIISCVDNNDLNTNTNRHELEGKWNLYEMDGYGVSVEYNENDVVWEFNTNQHSISVLINSNVETHPLLPLKANGTYLYNITDSNLITLDDIYSDVEYRYQVNNNELKLTLSNVQDPIILSFRR